MWRYRLASSDGSISVKDPAIVGLYAEREAGSPANTVMVVALDFRMDDDLGPVILRHSMN